MSEMVERVARAIAESHEPRNWDTMMECGREWWRKAARAAIKNMREPTGEMMEAALSFSDPGGDVSMTCMEVTYCAMIDAALK